MSPTYVGREKPRGKSPGFVHSLGECGEKIDRDHGENRLNPITVLKQFTYNTLVGYQQEDQQESQLKPAETNRTQLYLLLQPSGKNRWVFPEVSWVLV
ncbi:hypothetical protein JQC72_14700 [Polycladomyces sp. WAk]|uniref:Uncharacterized protein n=1 Tax=Polycladomyces zharkentensis TaxID=2807616 RepID=A0ABS2WME2_9BACL|nr:hypothetical protein [Polycladomyces sp. WAk]MBN2910747.1 hypothetical protein [Polycladomyces sp. WAk]